MNKKLRELVAELDEFDDVVQELQEKNEKYSYYVAEGFKDNYIVFEIEQ